MGNDVSDQAEGVGYPSKAFDAGLALGITRAVRLWAGWHPERMATLWRHYRVLARGGKHRARLYAQENLVVPPVVIFSPTVRCNLSCAGCYSRDYPMDGEMTPDEIAGLFGQAEQLGVNFFVITGGEPLLRQGLMELLAAYRRLIFLLFTNATLMDRAWAQRVARLGNVAPLLSVEGGEQDTDSRRGKGVYERVAVGMAHLNEAGAFFGFSAMVTRRSAATLGDEAFVDEMVARGCRVGVYSSYVPSGSSADAEWVPTREEQARFRGRVLDLRGRKAMILVHLPDDEFEQGGTCMAAGRGFVHVNAQGYVEPCPFAHWAADSVRTRSLKEALQAPLLAHIRDHPHLLQLPQKGCALFEHEEELRAAAMALGARPTDEG